MNLDARGDACPIPVVKTRKAIKELAQNESLSVAVDNAIAVQNLEKMCAETGVRFSSEKISDKHYAVTIWLGGEKPANESPSPSPDTGAEQPAAPPRRQNTLAVIPSSFMGAGDDRLGEALMKSFIYALAEGSPPDKAVFYNGGAKLTAEGSPAIPDLKRLEAAGTKIFTCGACINFYALAAAPAVGSVTNMYDIVAMMNAADRTIRP